jgi:hypothetical protein
MQGRNLYIVSKFIVEKTSRPKFDFKFRTQKVVQHMELS